MVINIEKYSKLIILIVIILIVIVGLILSSKIDFKLNKETTIPKEIESNTKDDSKDKIDEEGEVMKVIINNKEYEIILEDNETVTALLNLLPLELNMSELNDNEKYYYLDETLPTNQIVPTRIEKGDVMLYGNNCLVIFYKTFKTSYSYTKIGHIDNLPNLGSGNIEIKFNK